MKTKLIILVLLTSLSAITCTQKPDTTQTNPVYKHEWQIKVNFNLPALEPEAIQVALVDFDPIAKFIKDFDITYLSEKLNKAKDEKEKASQINSSITVTWDLHIFDDVKGSDLYLLTKKEFFLTNVSNSAQQKKTKWLVSKYFNLDDKPYCYAIPLELENGSKLEVTVDSTNLISLKDLYSKMKK